MSFPAVTTASVENIEAAVFYSVFVRAPGEKWQTLGDVAVGVLNARWFTSEDGYGEQRGIGTLNFSASCRMRQTSLQELQLMYLLCNGRNDFLFRLADSEAVSGIAAGGWVYVSASQVGLKARFVMQDERYLECEWQGSIYGSDANIVALVTPTLAVDDFESSAEAGTFHDIGTYTATHDGGSPNTLHIAGPGLESVTLDVVGGSTPVEMGPIKDAKVVVEMLATEDTLRRYLPNAVQFNVSYDWWSSIKGDLVLVGDMLPLRLNAVLTLIDGAQIYLSDQVGIKNDYHTADDLEGSRVVTFTHTGRAVNSAFDVRFNVDFTSTSVYFSSTFHKFSWN